MGELIWCGRFYGGWWQNIYKEARKKILINGAPVDEPDFSAYHINMLYALKKKPIPKEYPYQLDGYEMTPDNKKFLKRAVLISLNATGKTKEEGKIIALSRLEYEVSDR